MYKFDENALINELEGMPNAPRIAFAAATATRQLGSFERLACRYGAEAVQRPREIVVQLWDDLQEPIVNRAAWSERLDEVMGLLPEDSDDCLLGLAMAEDALSSVAYAIRCLITHSAQEAAWAARRAYEAADQAAIKVLGLTPGLPNVELVIRAHSFVQRELARQRNDLLLLHAANTIEDVRRNAFADKLLTEHEAAQLS